MKKQPPNPAKAMFERLVELVSPDERAAILEAECGSDPELRTQVEGLLQAYEQAGSFLEHPAVSPTKIDLQAETEDEGFTAVGGLLDTVADVSLGFLQPSTRAGSLGRLGQYEILEVIGRGGMGIVFKAEDTKLNRIVAVKVLAPEFASNPTARKRFAREAQAAAAISHDHVVTIHAVEKKEQGDLGQLPYLVTEFIDGQSLQQKLDRTGPLELREILRIGRQIAEGLTAAHEQGLIHRDIKPSNILLQNGIERVQITDFGLARAVDDVDITRTGEITGTPQYMSPEQAQGHPVDARSDLFSLGSVLYAMCTGRSPFRADSTMASLRRVCDDVPRPIRETNPDIPEWLVAIIDRLLEKDRENRLQKAKEVADVLGQYLALVQGPNSPPIPDLVQPVQRRRWNKLSTHRWLIAGVALVVVATLLGVTEATGVTQLSSTVIRIFTGEGTLVIKVDDPTVQVSLDGKNLSIRGTGVQEINLRPGKHQFQATKAGRMVKSELISIERNGRKVVNVSLEPVPAAKRASRNATSETPSFGSQPLKQFLKKRKEVEILSKAYEAAQESETAKLALANAHLSLAKMYYHHNLWPEAAQQFQAARRYSPKELDAFTCYRYGLTLLLLGEQARYLALCRDSVNRHAGSENPQTLIDVTRLCVMGPQETLVPKRLTGIAHKALAPDSDSIWKKFFVGMALMRAGEFTEAERLLPKASGEIWGAPKAGLALVYFKLGDRNTARDYWAETRRFHQSRILEALNRSSDERKLPSEMIVQGDAELTVLMHEAWRSFDPENCPPTIPEDPWQRLLRVKALLGIGELRKAEVELTNAIKASGSDPEILWWGKRIMNSTVNGMNDEK